MIKVSDIANIDLENCDEIWWIVRKLDRSLGSAKHVSELSPSSELFKEYRRVYHRGMFNDDYFQKVYVSRFLQELSVNKEALKLLKILCEESERKNIVLCCYCENENLCHRSLIAGILLGMGAVIDTELSYVRYFEKFKKYLDKESSSIIVFQ